MLAVCGSQRKEVKCGEKENSTIPPPLVLL